SSALWFITGEAVLDLAEHPVAAVLGDGFAFITALDLAEQLFDHLAFAGTVAAFLQVVACRLQLRLAALAVDEVEYHVLNLLAVHRSILAATECIANLAHPDLQPDHPAHLTVRQINGFTVNHRQPPASGAACSLHSASVTARCSADIRRSQRFPRRSVHGRS